MSNSKEEVLNLINSNVNLLLRSKESLYHNKVYAVYTGTRIDKFYKTKRGANGYINRNKDFSYYDDYTQNMKYPNSCIETIEIQEAELKDIQTDKELWQDYIRKHMSDITIHHLEDNIIYTAKNAGVTDELMTYIQGKIKEIKETDGMTIDQFPEQTKKEGNDEQINSTSTDTKNTFIEANSNTINVTGIQVNYNQGMNGVELIFTNKPDTEVLNQLKINGFRWSRRKKIWYGKDTPERRDFIKNTLRIENNINKSTVTEIKGDNESYPEININDIENYIVPDDISKRENDNTMFRSKDIDHTKELQETLQSANDDVIELCKMSGCTEYIKYKAKIYLQLFKRKYTDAYIAVIEHKANNISWMASGRGNLNVNRYNKKQHQYDNKLQYVSSLIDKFNIKIDQYKNKINTINTKKKMDQYLQDIKNIDISKENFERVKVNINRGALDHIFNNPNYETYSYKYKGYYIIKTWGSFTIYDNHGQEIEQIYKNGTLKGAKTYLIYYLSKPAITETAI